MKSVNQLVTELQAAIHSYYNEPDSATMSDQEFDALKEQLRKLDPEHPLLTQVGAPLTFTPLAKVARTVPMLSLEKATTVDQVRSWFLKAGANGAEVAVQKKLDGASLELTYAKGALVRAVTRGDGKTGEDVTHNAVNFIGVPHKLTEDIDCSVRGEVVLTKATAKMLFPEGCKNIRNVGTGIMRRLDGVNSEHLTFFAYNILTEDFDIQSEKNSLHTLANLGFAVEPTFFVDTLEAIQSALDDLEVERTSGDIQIDGAVLKFSDLNIQRRLGFKTDCPVGQLAFKWDSEFAETIITDILLTVGHTGNICPTAVFEPIELQDTTITHAQLFNWDRIQELGVAVGDTVIVSKRNDIIPHVERVVSKPDSRVEIPEPESCPVCNHRTARNLKGQGAITLCTNYVCSARIFARIKKWIQERNILGVGDEVIQSAINAFGLEDAADLYTVSTENWINMPFSKSTFGEPRAAKLVAELDKSKQATLPEFLGSVGVQHLGQRRVELVMTKAKGKLDNLENWMDGTTLDQVAASCQIPNIAKEIKASLEDFALSIEKLDKYIHIQPLAKVEVSADALSFCLTGAMSRSRKLIEGDIVAAGHLAWDDVKKGLNYLVLADPNSNSSKAVKARSLGVKLITEEELMKLIA